MVSVDAVIGKDQVDWVAEVEVRSGRVVDISYC